jgi:hypothetical protein
LVLPDPGVQPGAANYELNVGMAARWVLRQIGVSNSRLEGGLGKALTARQHMAGGELLAVTAQLAVASYARYQAAMADGQLRFGPWSPAKFFGEGHWLMPASWPWTQEGRVAQAGTMPGPSEDEREQERAALVAKVAQFLRENARQLDMLNLGMEAEYAVRPVIEGLRKLAADVVAERVSVDAAYVFSANLEDQLIAALVDTVPQAKAAAEAIAARVQTRPGGEAARTEAAKTMRRAQVSKICNTPYLDLRYMP